MPIEFAQPEPFAPGINAAYGAQQEYDQFAPILQQQRSQANSLLEGQASRELAGGLAAAQARLASQTAGAHIASDNQNAALAAGTHQQIAREQNANEQYLAQVHSVDQQNAQTFAGAQGQFDAQQHAEIQNWLMGQEMTQQEQMRLQRQQYAVAEIQNDPGLSDQEKMDYIRELKTGIDVGKQRLQRTQQQHMEQQNQLQAQQLQTAKAHELAARKLEAKSLPDRTQTVYSEALTNAITPDVTSEFDRQFPGWANSPTLAPARQAAIQKEVWARVADQGGATEYLEAKAGHFEVVKHANHPEEVAKTQATYEKQFQDAQKHYDSMLSTKVKEVQKEHKDNADFTDNPPSYDALVAIAQKRLEAQGVKPPTLKVAGADKPKRQAWAGIMTPSARTSADGSPPAASGQPSPADLDKPVPEKPADWTPYQRGQMTDFHRGTQEIMTRTDLPPTLRKEYLDAFEKAKSLFVAGEAGKKRDEFKKLTDFLATMPPRPGQQQPQASPAPTQQPVRSFKPDPFAPGAFQNF